MRRVLTSYSILNASLGASKSLYLMLEITSQHLGESQSELSNGRLIFIPISNVMEAMTRSKYWIALTGMYALFVLSSCWDWCIRYRPGSTGKVWISLWIWPMTKPLRMVHILLHKVGMHLEHKIASNFLFIHQTWISSIPIRKVRGRQYPLFYLWLLISDHTVCSRISWIPVKNWRGATS